MNKAAHFRPLPLDQLLSTIVDGYRNPQMQVFISPRLPAGGSGTPCLMQREAGLPAPSILDTCTLISHTDLSDGFFDCGCCNYGRTISLARLENGVFAVLYEDEVAETFDDIFDKDSMGDRDARLIRKAFSVAEALNKTVPAEPLEHGETPATFKEAYNIGTFWGFRNGWNAAVAEIAEKAGK